MLRRVWRSQRETMELPGVKVQWDEGSATIEVDFPLRGERQPFILHAQMDQQTAERVAEVFSACCGGLQDTLQERTES